MSFLTITAVIVFAVLFAILFKTGFKQINLLASAPQGHNDHHSPEKTPKRKHAKDKRHTVTEHVAANNQRNIENPDR